MADADTEAVTEDNNDSGNDSQALQETDLQNNDEKEKIEFS